jgi:hypothetical protein
MAMKGRPVDAVPGATSAGSHTDPTQQAAIRLADMPEVLKEKAAWVKVIDDTWKDCVTEDGGDPHGLAYLMDKNFRLTGEETGEDQNAVVREEIMKTCDISQRTFYSRLTTVADMLVYHATKRGLL